MVDSQFNRRASFRRRYFGATCDGVETGGEA